MKSTFKKFSIVIAAFLMSIVTGLDMSVVRKLKPDAYDLGGYIYQLIGRTFQSISTDKIALAFLFFGSLWLANRYIFHKPKNTKAGEYIIVGFLSVMMLVCASIKATGSVQTLYENFFQMIKALMYLLGMFSLFLCAIRGLNELLTKQQKKLHIELWSKHPFAFPLVVISIFWIGQVIVKYPGVLAIDTVIPVKQFQGEWTRTTAHPVFGTLLYGVMVTVGQQIGNVNIVYFAVMLMQVIALLAVISYIMWLMNTKGLPSWVQVASLFLFAISPIYIGWAVVIIKDTPYLITTLLAGALLLECCYDVKAFIRKKSRWFIIAVGFSLMILTRYNGIYIVVPVLIVMLVAMLKKHLTTKVVVRFSVFGCLVILFCTGVSETIITTIGIQKIKFYDWLSVPFQQTARVAMLYGDSISEQDKDDINTMIQYDLLAEKYDPDDADQVKWTLDQETRGTRTPGRYLRVWWKQFRQYPMDYLDALLNLNCIMFDLQDNSPVYIGLSDTSLYYYVYPYSFTDMSYYDSEAIQGLNSYQMALTQWYFNFSDIPVIGWFASMGFCVDVMIVMAYLAWINGRKKVLLVMIPSLITAFTTLFCSVVYTRYLLPTIGSLPLWFAAYYMLLKVNKRDDNLSIEA